MSTHTGIPLTLLPGVREAMKNIKQDNGNLETPASCYYEDLKKVLQLNPSLVITPNAFKTGKLYSTIPGAAGDLDVVRATSATRVNEQGLVEIPRTNLLLRSEEFNVSPWINIALQSVVSNTEVAPSGTLTAEKIIPNTTNTNHYVQQILTVVSGQTYTFSFFAKKAEYNFTSTFISALNIGVAWDLQNGIASSGASIEDYGNGWYRCIVSGVAVSTSASIRIYVQNSSSGVFAGDGTSGIFIWGAQLEQGVSATEYIPTTSSIRTRFAGITQDGASASNIPRLDYTNGSCPSILVEPQRTNLLRFSNIFVDNGWIVSESTITNNYSLSPDGTNNANRWLSNSGSTASILTFGPTTSDNTTYTISCWVKSNGNNKDKFRFIISSAFVSSDFTATSEWQRFTYTATRLTTGTRFGLLRPSDNSEVDLQIYGAQLEVGSNATSYIPTVGSAVTRNADVISKTGISSLIGQTEGTLFFEFTGEPQSNVYYSLSTGVLSNTILVGLNPAGLINARIFAPFPTNPVNVGNFAYIAGQRYKVAFAYNSTQCAIAVNGVLQTTSGFTGFAAGTLSRLGIDNSSNGSQVLLGKHHQVAIFNTRLSNSEITTLTTI